MATDAQYALKEVVYYYRLSHKHPLLMFGTRYGNETLNSTPIVVLL